MKTKTIKLYSFDELDEEVQEKLIDKQRGRDLLPSDWYYPTVEEFIEEAEDLGFEFNEGIEDISFNLYGRESHFGIYNDCFWFKDNVLEDYSVVAETKRGVKKFGYYFNDFPTRGWFTSDIRVFIDELLDKDGELIEEDDERFEEVEEELNGKLADLAELCKKYYKRLEKDMEYYYSEEKISDFLRKGGEVFREDGRRFY